MLSETNSGGLSLSTAVCTDVKIHRFNVYWLAALCFIEQMCGDRADDTYDFTFWGNDLQTLSQNSLAPPAPEWLEIYHAVIANSRSDKANLIKMPCYHYARSLGIAAQHAKQAAHAVLDKLFRICR
ncbi:hypothetical protein D3C81_1649280 [compost metagenome]